MNVVCKFFCLLVWALMWIAAVGASNEVEVSVEAVDEEAQPVLSAQFETSADRYYEIEWSLDLVEWFPLEESFDKNRRVAGLPLVDESGRAVFYRVASSDDASLLSDLDLRNSISLVDLSASKVELVVASDVSDASELVVRLFGPDGELIGEQVKPYGGATTAVTFSGTIDLDKKAFYAVEWAFGDGEVLRRSLGFMEPLLETVAVGGSRYVVGMDSVLQVVTSDRAIGRPMGGVSVEVELVSGDSTRVVYSGESDRSGLLRVPLRFEEGDEGAGVLKVKTSMGDQSNVVSQSIEVGDGSRTMLTTDKPLYQPGQTIHMRVLMLNRVSRASVGDEDVVFEVEDAKGNKVFKQVEKTNDFGVASADFVLATQLNEGVYKIRVIGGEEDAEKSVVVERYVLPKFKVDTQMDSSFSKPGERVEGRVQADYFFGQPVANADVTIVARKFDLEFEEFATIRGKTDDEGAFEWSVDLPEYFVGQPLNSGKAFVVFDVSVVDGAGQTIEVAQNHSVVGSPISVVAVPESGALVTGLENTVYLVATYADGSPVEGEVSWSFGDGGEGMEGIVDTNSGGFASIVFTPNSSVGVFGTDGGAFDGDQRDGYALGELRLDVRDQRGVRVEATVDLDLSRGSGDQVLLRMDDVLFDVGDLISATVHTTSNARSVYFDVVQEGQTRLTKVARLENGRAHFYLDSDVSLEGTLTLSAWVLGRDGNIVRDQRILVVEPARELSLKVTADKEEYVPGGEAVLSIETLDEQGTGVASAVLLSIVDEAVYALQEMQPGLEKVFYYLEEEIAKPRLEIHGWEVEDLVVSDPDLYLNRDYAARALLASSEGAEAASGARVSSYGELEVLDSFRSEGRAYLDPVGEAVESAIQEYIKLVDRESYGLPEDFVFKDLYEAGVLEEGDMVDPWGGAVEVLNFDLLVGGRVDYVFTLSSLGPDRELGTADDLAAIFPYWRSGGDDWVWGDGIRFVDDVDGMFPPEMVLDSDGPGEGSGAGSGGEEPRVRSYFPETLLWEPSVITDGSGKAEIRVPLADSITTWRMTGMANTQGGLLGSMTQGLRVFQDFFVDIDFPVNLTQNDEVSAPVVVYNYLEEEQEVRLVVEGADWFELLGPAEQIVTVGPKEVVGLRFPFRALKVGRKSFVVKAYSENMSDAVSRTVDIRPDGVEQIFSESSRMSAEVVSVFDVSADAIADASTALLKIYPGVFSQLVEGLDKILRMPSGCFEQTSSATYPNVLVLDYMNETGVVTPELSLKAESFINTGYQRLLSYEVDGGGFSWFGEAPAHRILTAYGLMEFYDMSQVATVDPLIISRTQDWLVSLQDGDGSWSPDNTGIREGAINAFTDDVFRTTAYIALALKRSGYVGGALQNAENWMAANLDKAVDTYTLALAANVFALLDNEPVTEQLVGELLSRKIEDGDLVYWASQSETPTYGSGRSADVEVTAWAIMALLRSSESPTVVAKGISFLVSQKDSFGTFQSTQSTIVALQAMILAESSGSAEVNLDVAVTMNGESVGAIAITPETSDVMRVLDLTPYLVEGENRCELSSVGDAESLFYQVSGSYWVASDDVLSGGGGSSEEALGIEVEYEKTELKTNDRVTATVTVSNVTDGRFKMLIVDVGIPPAFTVIEDALEAYVSDGVIDRYSITGRQIIIYVDTLESGDDLVLSYELEARFPVKAAIPESTVYSYYDPDRKATADSGEILVED